ncbi:acyl carrier protein [Flavobacterium sp. Fl-77]|uniref:Acyl carrier protein n=1 Tax=Flavobacterium flavipigmentatum TaxID=2893884 RepID=A0AAJ2VYK6_9FLAO|nr:MULTISPECIES: acyl carrier protein [unclassified Flavobacterium]MDX6182891.1 acyl carrier protein [Flavobacterium sp. Fl-33]MDX6186344.1 acyl carrier protein [Flavobacterium sp. Fl-77]UFH37868.1 acyl carrier protein [Flavobacterium sp. F-70]
MNTIAQLHHVFARAFEIPVESVNDQLEYQAIVEWDSMSHLVLIEELESTYKISIEMEDILEMSSVERIKIVLKKYGFEIN